MFERQSKNEATGFGWEQALTGALARINLRLDRLFKQIGRIDRRLREHLSKHCQPGRGAKGGEWQ